MGFPSLTWVAWFSWNLDKAVIETEIVTDGVLPARELCSVKGELLHNKITDATQSQLLLFRLKYIYRVIEVDFMNILMRRSNVAVLLPVV